MQILALLSIKVRILTKWQKFFVYKPMISRFDNKYIGLDLTKLDVQRLLLV